VVLDIGDAASGFVGMDDKPGKTAERGVATSPEDIVFLAKVLLEYGYDPHKRLFVLQPPYIQERIEGKVLRRSGLTNLGDFARADIGKLEKVLGDIHHNEGEKVPHQIYPLPPQG